jgi:hypothetical protein
MQVSILKFQDEIEAATKGNAWIDELILDKAYPEYQIDSDRGHTILYRNFKIYAMSVIVRDYANKSVLLMVGPDVE